MEIVSYRLVKERHAQTAFDGEGARLFGGRWNSRGIPLVYTSESLALCCLEIFVHLPSYNLLNDYVYIQASFDDELVEDAQLFDGWDERPVSKVSQAIGDQWASKKQSPVLRVPSVIVPESNNYLIDVSHPDVGKIKTSDPRPLSFDPRIKKE